MVEVLSPAVEVKTPKETAEVLRFDGTKKSWNKNRGKIEELLGILGWKSDGEILGEKPYPGESGTFPPAFKNIKKAMRSGRTVGVLLKVDGEVSGLCLAMPMRDFDPDRKKPDYKNRAYIYFTAIDPGYQGQGMIEPVMDKTFEELAKKGYQYTEVDAKLKNDFGGKLQKVYNAFLTEETYDHDKWGLGMQRHLSIDMRKYLASKTRR